MGLSPRARGHLAKGATNDELQRSIPACAGEPDRENLPLARWTVYPRVRGGTDGLHLFIEAATGLSPRARGNLPTLAVRAICFGSIPACAGEPQCQRNLWIRTGVYPRVRGGTSESGSADDARYGLSPRARGNLLTLAVRAICFGSIPACAGEPSGRSTRRLTTTVYPRVRGGTGASVRLKDMICGLSPRARGNPS